MNRLFDLVPMDSIEEVFKEVLIILKMISPNFDISPVSYVFNKAVDLYRGNHPGYQACNTGFHDLRHTTDTFLAMARLLHGAVIDGENLSERLIRLGLIAAILHDSGYIQEDHDTEGTGAKHTVSHIKRSMDFLDAYGAEYGLTDEEIAAGCNMIRCTDLAVDITKIDFSSDKIELLGKILGTADLVAQMADRAYLEKLLFLYYEFSEAGIGDYNSEVDLLRKTVAFYDFIAQRLEKTLDATDQFLYSHFVARWNIRSNLYQVSIQNQKDYLLKILEKPSSDPRVFLKREGIVDKLRQKHPQD